MHVRANAAGLTSVHARLSAEFREGVDTGQRRGTSQEPAPYSVRVQRSISVAGRPAAVAGHIAQLLRPRAAVDQQCWHHRQRQRSVVLYRRAVVQGRHHAVLHPRVCAAPYPGALRREGLGAVLRSTAPIRCVPDLPARHASWLIFILAVVMLTHPRRDIPSVRQYTAVSTLLRAFGAAV